MTKRDTHRYAWWSRRYYKPFHFAVETSDLGPALLDRLREEMGESVLRLLTVESACQYLAVRELRELQQTRQLGAAEERHEVWAGIA